jgi:SAM-dependent methyltransferase
MDHNPIAIRVFDAGARAYDEAFSDTSLFHPSFDRFLDLITIPNAEVLELGCGPGNITRYLLAQRPDLQILGTDLAPRMLELARNHNPSASFELLDARRITSLGRTFDAIVCGFCLPYLTPPEAAALIRDAASILHRDGVLYLSTMEDDPAKSGFKLPSSGKGEAAFIQYYQADFLTDVLLANGMTVRHLDRVEYIGKYSLPVTDVLVIAQKQ